MRLRANGHNFSKLNKGMEFVFNGRIVLNGKFDRLNVYSRPKFLIIKLTQGRKGREVIISDASTNTQL